MPNLIVVAGLPGSGKTFFARQLAQRINAVHIGSDDTRTKMGARGKYSMNDRLRVYKEMALLAEKCLDRGRSVIADATFHHHVMRSVFVKLALEYSISIRFIVVWASDVVIQQRLAAPRPDSEADIQVYNLIKSKFEPFTIPHLSLQSTEGNAEEMIDEAVRYINLES